MKKLPIFIFLVIMLSVVFVSAEENLILKIETNRLESAMNTIRNSAFVLYFKLGNLYFRNGNVDDAIRLFEKVGILNPNFAMAHHNLGVVYYSQNRTDKAIEEFKRAIEIDKEYAKAHYSIALVYYKSGEYSSAIDELEEVIRIEPDNANAQFDLAVSYADRFRYRNGNADNLANAESHFIKADNIMPGFPHARENAMVIRGIMEDEESLNNNFI